MSDTDRLAVNWVSIDDVTTAPWNARTDHDIDGIAESIRINGFRDPIEVWASSGGERLGTPHMTVAGEGRLRAAVKLGLKRVPVIEHDFADEAAAKRYSIANNRLTDKSSWDEPLLAATLSELAALDALDGSGFELTDLADFGVSDDERELLSDENDIPEQAGSTIVEPGDIWVFGEHRILCGDCRQSEAVERLFDGVAPGLVVTDPPYAVDYVQKARDMYRAGYGHSAGSHRMEITGDHTVGSDARMLWEASFRCALDHVTPNAAWYVWHPPGRDMLRLHDVMSELGFLYHQQILWAKDNFVLGRGDYHYAHEPCYYGWQKGHRPPFYGERNQTTVWRVRRDRETEHPTQKPVGLYEPPIRNHLKPGEALYDPFVGSGTAIIAAEKLGRRCFAVDIEPVYVDVVIRRWQAATGQRARRESDGVEYPITPEAGE